MQNKKEGQRSLQLCPHCLKMLEARVTDGKIKITKESDNYKDFASTGEN